MGAGEPAHTGSLLQCRQSDGHMHTDSLCTGSVPSGSVASLCFHLSSSSHHVSSSRPWPRRYRPPRHVARPGLSVERPPIRPVFRAHTRSPPCSSGAPSRSSVGTSVPTRSAVWTKIVSSFPKPLDAPSNGRSPAARIATSRRPTISDVRRQQELTRVRQRQLAQARLAKILDLSSFSFISFSPPRPPILASVAALSNVLRATVTFLLAQHGSNTSAPQ